MAMETVTNYKCDRCGRSELRDGATILTLTVRQRAKNTPGQGPSEYTKHVCEDNCLKIIKAAMNPVGIPGRYDRKSAAQRRHASITQTPDKITPKGGTKGSTKAAKGSTKRGTKNGSAPGSRTVTTLESPSASQARADVVKAVRAITRTEHGGWAKGHNYRTERKMIAERESLKSD